LTNRAPGTSMGTGQLVAAIGGILATTGVAIAALTIRYNKKKSVINAISK